MKKDSTTQFKQSTLLPWVEMRVANQSRACYEAHSHDEFSFGIIEQGHSDYKNRHRVNDVRVGDIVTINPADVHSCNPKGNTWSYSMLFVDTLKMGEIQQDILQHAHRGYNQDYTPFKNDLERNPLIQTHFLALLEALIDDNSPLKAQVAFYDFIESSFWQHKLSTEKTQREGDVLRVREKMLDELTEIHQLDSLAEEAGMSRYQLIRAFRQRFGLPPHAYLMDEKIKRAKVLLREGKEISEVAFELGFSDQAHFQRHFKKKLAVTPKYYQSHFIGN
ncbi:Transcriptional regulator, AraC family [Grimontia indica]|uniref:Transcriptional regulator, AraC family n=1 Tax=Grimontia indica TaxID=1056512 RepID=R1IRD4_9GAMM|nr:AraC family transcriptional regulator [Grimontia indica]EOD80032.1 Transcriptional regulator, AraC family [Grimontia indica]